MNEMAEVLVQRLTADSKVQAAASQMSCLTELLHALALDTIGTTAFG